MQGCRTQVLHQDKEHQAKEEAEEEEKYSDEVLQQREASKESKVRHQDKDKCNRGHHKCWFCLGSRRAKTAPKKIKK